ncbi:MAG: rod shape-determining protein MreC [Acidobacteriota bacterium]
MMRERWHNLLLAVLLLSHLFLLANRPDAEDSRFDRMFLATVAPVADGAVGVVDGIGTRAKRLRTRSQIIEENTRLRSEVAELEAELVRYSGLEAELDNLELIANVASLERSEVIVADVVLADYATAIKTLLIDAGNAELRYNQAVRTTDGLVGRVVTTSGSYAKVQLVTDRSAAVSAMIARTRRKGVVRGTGGSLLAFDYLPRRANVQKGDLVTTAGIDGIFERGIPIGTVAEVHDGDDLFHEIEVIPAADFSRLDLVYVLPDDPLPDEIVEELDALP